jgi:hypothetical protein
VTGASTLMQEQRGLHRWVGLHRWRVVNTRMQCEPLASERCTFVMNVTFWNFPTCLVVTNNKQRFEGSKIG